MALASSLFSARTLSGGMPRVKSHIPPVLKLVGSTLGNRAGSPRFTHPGPLAGWKEMDISAKLHSVVRVLQAPSQPNLLYPSSLCSSTGQRSIPAAPCPNSYSRLSYFSFVVLKKTLWLKQCIKKRCIGGSWFQKNGAMTML